MAGVMSQVDMGFLSPEIERHTFPENIGAWNSHHDKHGEIFTADGRHLVVAVRIADAEPNALRAVINSAEVLIEHGGYTADGYIRGTPWPVSSVTLFVAYTHDYGLSRMKSSGRPAWPTRKRTGVKLRK